MRDTYLATTTGEYLQPDGKLGPRDTALKIILAEATTRERRNEKVGKLKLYARR